MLYYIDETNFFKLKRMIHALYCELDESIVKEFASILCRFEQMEDGDEKLR